MASSLGAQGRFLSGELTVDAAGTAQPLSDGVAAGGNFWKSVVIVAKSGNAGQVYVGGSDVDSSTNDGLDAGESISLSSDDYSLDISDIYIDVGTTDDGVDFYAVKS